ncbi:MAG: sigma-70 family RNA polymerase sigma factor [Sphingobium sp.]|nr:sigma-70 family RNA polymerase sigma factor [Sphingobium sp.]
MLFMAHRRELVNYANGIVRDHALAEDVVQEAYLRFSSARQGKPLEEPAGYLYRIVRNLAVDSLRRIQRENLRLPDADADELAAIPTEAPSPEAVVAGRDELRFLQDAMAELPERTRIALEMHRFGGMTFKDIAEHLGISVGLAHAMVIDGLEHCRARLCRSK